MKPKDEFLMAFRYKMAGMAMFGYVSDQRDGPTVRATKVMEIPADVEAFLSQIYDWLKAKEPAPPKDKLVDTPQKGPQK